MSSSVLYELVWEGFSPEQFNNFLTAYTHFGELVKSCDFSDVDSGQSLPINLKDKIVISQQTMDLDSWTLVVGLQFISFPGVKLNDTQILATKRDQDIMLSVNFPKKELPAPLDTAQKKLMQAARIVANMYGVKNYFGGLDPAENEDTRLFTGNRIGPHSL